MDNKNLQIRSNSTRLKSPSNSRKKQIIGIEKFSSPKKNNIRPKSFDKKGAFAIQFNWLFAIIIGAIILGIFYSIAQTILESSKQELSDELRDKFNTILIATKTSSGFSDTIPAVDLKFEFKKDCSFTVGDSEGIYIREMFGPRYMSGKNIIPWTIPWKAPFKVTNFLLLTTPQDKFYIMIPKPENPEAPDQDEAPKIELAEKFYREFPKTISKNNLKLIYCDAETKERMKFSKKYKYHFIEFGCDDGYLENLVSAGATEGSVGSSSDIMAISINTDYQKQYKDFSQSKVTIYNYKKGQGLDDEVEKTLYGKAMLFAAAFAYAPNLEICGGAQALEDLAFLADIYHARAVAIAEALPEEDSCKGMLETYADELEALKNIPNAVDFLAFIPAIEAVEEANSNLEYQSCPRLY